MKDHHEIIYSFGLILPAIFPDTDISSCVCIVLLFETSSSSHVESIIARQRGPVGPEAVIWPCLTASNHEICHIPNHARGLESIQSFSYWFSWWPRYNPMKQTDNISYHKRREPKRTYKSWDIDEKPSRNYTWFRHDIACNIPWHRYIFLCLWSIALWNRFFEPCGIVHCASAQTFRPWYGHFALSNGI